MFFLLPLVGAAVGAVAGALVTHATGEKDRQSAEQHKKVANQLTDDYSKLQKRYNELADKSTKQIVDLKRKLALAEVDKDLLRLALRLQQEHIKLMFEIDKRPSKAALIQFKAAVLDINQVLSQLNEQVIVIPDDYFTRNMTRAKRLEKEKKLILTARLQQPEFVDTTQPVGYTQRDWIQEAESRSKSKRKKTSKRVNKHWNRNIR